jgi:hypothetical protein
VGSEFWLAAELDAFLLGVGPDGRGALHDPPALQLGDNAQHHKHQLGKSEVVSTTGSAIERNPSPALWVSRAITRRLLPAALAALRVVVPNCVPNQALRHFGLVPYQLVPYQAICFMLPCTEILRRDRRCLKECRCSLMAKHLLPAVPCLFWLVIGVTAKFVCWSGQ